MIEVRVPTVVGGPHLRTALDSVLAQTRPDWRLVVQENGPGLVAVRELVAPYLDDPRVSHVVTGELLSQAANWSRAIAEAGAPYIALLHDDDVWDPPFLDRRLTLLERHRHCGFAFSSHVEIDGDGVEIRRRPLLFAEGVLSRHELVRALYRTQFIQPPSIVVRREAYQDVGPAFDERWPAFIDYEMWMRLAVRFPAVYLHAHDSRWRVHEGSMTAALPHLGEPYLTFAAHMDQLIARELPSLRLDDQLRRRKRAYAHVKSSLDAAEDGDRRHAAHHLRQAVRTYKRSAFDPRVPLALVGTLGGRRTASPLAALRRFTKRHELRLHVREKPI